MKTVKTFKEWLSATNEAEQVYGNDNGASETIDTTDSYDSEESEKLQIDAIKSKTAKDLFGETITAAAIEESEDYATLDTDQFDLDSFISDEELQSVSDSSTDLDF